MVNNYSNNYMAGGRFAGLNKREKMTNSKIKKLSSIPMTQIGALFSLLFLSFAFTRFTFDVGNISSVYLCLMVSFFLITHYCEASLGESYLTKMNNMRKSVFDCLVFIPVFALVGVAVYTAYTVASQQSEYWKSGLVFIFYAAAIWSLIYYLPTRSYIDQVEPTKDNDGVFNNPIALAWRKALKGRWYTYIAQLVCVSTILFFLPALMCYSQFKGMPLGLQNASIVYLFVALLFLTFTRHLTENFRGMVILMLVIVLLSPIAANDSVAISFNMGFIPLLAGGCFVYFMVYSAISWISAVAYRGKNNIIVSPVALLSYAAMIFTFLFGIYSTNMQVTSSVISKAEDGPSLKMLEESFSERTYLGFDGYKPELKVLNVKAMAEKKFGEARAKAKSVDVKNGEGSSADLFSLDSALNVAVSDIAKLGYTVTKEDVSAKLDEVKLFTPSLYEKITTLEELKRNGDLTALANGEKQSKQDELVEQSKSYVFVQMARVTKPTFEKILPAFKWFYETKKSESPDAIKLVDFAVQRDAAGFWKTYQSIYNEGKVTLETESFASRINEIEGMEMDNSKSVPFPEFKLDGVPKINSFSMGEDEGAKTKVGEEMIDVKRFDLIYNDIESTVLAGRILND